MVPPRLPLVRCLLLLAVMVGAGEGRALRAAESPEDFFEKRIRPVLAEHCFECHEGDAGKVEGELRVDSRAALLKGGTRGPALVPGKPQESLLVLAVQHADQLNMPPRNKLPEAQIRDLMTWIEQGAPWPGESDTAASATQATAGSASTNRADAPTLWSLQPLGDARPPEVRDTSWPRQALDHFVLARLEAEGLRPAPPATRRAWLRRVTFDLTGLPPTPAELRAFEADGEPDAEARVVDRLLASPRYGERWGRHWLDVARYADSNGMDENLAYANAFQYRDYVVRSFNADKPFDRFATEQLAGDLLPNLADDAARDARIATGFLSLGAKMLAEDDPVKMQMDIVDEQIDTMGRAFMGMTLGCARCHDHKFDPLSARDYYGLAGIFKSTRTMENFSVVARWQEQSVADSALAARHQEISARITALPKDSEEAKQLEATLPVLPAAMMVSEGEVQDTKIHIRGSHVTLGDLVQRGFPEIILPAQSWPIAQASSGRLQLAQWLTDPRHPLTARVLVNRLWQGHFGEGLVRSPDNFGQLGDRPAHPELLDYLARQFLHGGWSLKELHRDILLSASYRMGSHYDAQAFERDPDNRLLWRVNRRRLEAEAIRDAVLAVSGQLDLHMGGSQLPTPNREYVTSTANVNPVAYEGQRRSLYLPVVRSALFELFQAFDFADPSVQAGRRDTTTVAPQALFMMNSQLVTEQMKAWSGRLLAEASVDDAGRVGIVYETALGRPPTNEETVAALAYVERFRQTLAARGKAADEAHRAAWESLCRATVATNEFLFID